ncbi:unnamed protein product [Arabis nemorensis]|uniref:SRP54-type proteins GTP-binding domain-containing protein n=1 Tax=Arabis nemorensis TaxID=586526 RepID=A0A565CXG0_9BRAS|nr:unnamed protein product [Arabis nemorensis]
MDGSIGQAAFDQAQAFKQSFPVGAVMVTNVNTAPKACGAISKCPMILAETGTGVKGEEFEAFEAKPFVRSLFKNPWVSPNYQPGSSLRQMYAYYRKQLGLEKENDFSFGPHVPSKLSDKKVKLYVTIMTDEELDKSQGTGDGDS